jgi:hypothetical protein
MERRTVLRRLGAASAGVAGLSGVASAGNAPLNGALEGMGSVDVADRSGQVPLSELLTDEQLAQASDGVDPTKMSVIVDESDTTVNFNDPCGCYIGCCEWDNPCVECCQCVCDNCDNEKVREE